MSLLTLARRSKRDTGVVKSDDLRLSVVRRLRQTLFVTLITEIEQDDAGVHDYRIEVGVRWNPDEGPDVDLAELALLSHVDVESYLPELIKSLPKTLVVPVATGSVAVVDLANPDCLEQLRARSMDLALVGEALWGEDLDLRPLTEQYPLTSLRVLIANNLVVLPEWRGAGMGLLAMELVLERLRPGLALAALYPMQPGLTDFAERNASNERLSSYWSRIGFEPFEGIMVRPL